MIVLLGKEGVLVENGHVSPYYPTRWVKRSCATCAQHVLHMGETKGNNPSGRMGVLAEMKEI